MRKLNPRIIVFIIVALISITSHWYLNTDVDRSTLFKRPHPDALQAASEEEVEDESAQPVLPDVLLLKKVVETGRRLIPAN